MSFKVPEKYRVESGRMGSDKSYGNNGAFFIPRNGENVPLRCIAADGMGWEHVSVSLPDRAPTWDEMQKIKDLFWDPFDTVIQYHVPASNHINNHPNCLHLWRPVDQEIPMPNSLKFQCRTA